MQLWPMSELLAIMMVTEWSTCHGDPGTTEGGGGSGSHRRDRKSR